MTNILALLFAALTAFIPISGMAMHAYNVANEHIRILHTPPRLQWNENSGYCGEVALISAGLYFGQYISQYDARAIACQGNDQKSCQLLLGLNAHAAAAKMHLESHEWASFQNESTDDFLSWIKENVIHGCPVAIGIYMNQYRFYHNSHPNAGDPSYDHIVLVTGIGSNLPFTNTSYDGDDILYFTDNGLWGDPCNPHYKFSYNFDAFQATRQQANTKHGPVYSLPLEGHNYGIAIRGVLDLNNETVRVRLETNPNSEHPDIQNGSNARPAPTPLKLTLTMTDLEPGVAYNLYRYNSFDAVPNSNFNAHAKQASAHWQVQIESGSTYVMTLNISSDEMAIFRAVKASGP
ncbi:MAG: hypothetical protein K2P51_00090 [Rhabdochlamydiaceae bacterium]|nr:hypothetical protein [Rhabdochlamydiaceae bacterium]